MSKAFALVHGGGQGSWIWQETIAALALQSGGTAVVTTLDVPGCGIKRSRDTSGLGMAAIADELAADLAADHAAHAGQVTLVAHSQGGTVAPLIAARRPDLVRRMVHISALAPWREETASSWRASLPPAVTMLDRHAPGARDRYRSLFCNDMNEGQATRFLDQLGEDQWPRGSYTEPGWRYDHLAAIPSTYVICLQDRSLPVAWQEIFAERLHAKPIYVDAGHQALNTRPQAIAELLLAGD